MNINIDNYEAYLIDYLDGNLTAEETAQLKAFVEAQGLDWAGLTEEMPQLAAPSVVFENKEALKRKPMVIPMFVKIVSAAAAVALLFILVWKPGSRMPEQEMTAELKPIGANEVAVEETVLLAESQASFKLPATKATSVAKRNAAPQTREAQPLLAELKPVVSPYLPELEFQGALAYGDHLKDENYLMEDEDQYFHLDDQNELSLVSRGIQKLTDGKCDSFASMFREGWQMAKTELAMAKEQSFSLPLQKIREYDSELYHMER